MESAQRRQAEQWRAVQKEGSGSAVGPGLHPSALGSCGAGGPRPESVSACLPPALSLRQASGSVTEHFRLSAGQDHVSGTGEGQGGGTRPQDLLSKPRRPPLLPTFSLVSSTPLRHHLPDHSEGPSSDLGTKLRVTRDQKLAKTFPALSRVHPGAKRENSNHCPLWFARNEIFKEQVRLIQQDPYYFSFEARRGFRSEGNLPKRSMDLPSRRHLKTNFRPLPNP